MILPKLCIKQGYFIQGSVLFARAAHWFNPLVHIMSVEANKDINCL